MFFFVRFISGSSPRIGFVGPFLSPAFETWQFAPRSESILDPVALQYNKLNHWIRLQEQKPWNTSPKCWRWKQIVLWRLATHSSRNGWLFCDGDYILWNYLQPFHTKQLDIWFNECIVFISTLPSLFLLQMFFWGMRGNLTMWAKCRCFFDRTYKITIHLAPWSMNPPRAGQPLEHLSFFPVLTHTLSTQIIEYIIMNRRNTDTFKIIQGCRGSYPKKNI